MFAPFMTNTWVVGTIVALLAGVVGFFVVLRGRAFAAHAIPNGAFAGAAMANLVGISSLLGLGAFSLLAALGIGALSRRGRQDAVTALALVFMLALGAFILSRSSEYESVIYSLLFGDVLGISNSEILPVAVIAGACMITLALTYRPLLFSSLLPEVAAAKGLRAVRIEILFLVVLAAATAVTVPVVGALLIFSLLIGPPAAARALSRRLGPAIVLAVVLALATIWIAIACSFETNWPIGFFVGSVSAFFYGAGRLFGTRKPPAASRQGLSHHPAVPRLGWPLGG